MSPQQPIPGADLPWFVRMFMQGKAGQPPAPAAPTVPAEPQMSVQPPGPVPDYNFTPAPPPAPAAPARPRQPAAPPAQAAAPEMAPQEIAPTPPPPEPTPDDIAATQGAEASLPSYAGFFRQKYGWPEGADSGALGAAQGDAAGQERQNYLSSIGLSSTGSARHQAPNIQYPDANRPIRNVAQQQMTAAGGEELAQNQLKTDMQKAQTAMQISMLDPRGQYSKDLATTILNHPAGQQLRRSLGANADRYPAYYLLQMLQAMKEPGELAKLGAEADSSSAIARKANAEADKQISWNKSASDPDHEISRGARHLLMQLNPKLAKQMPNATALELESIVKSSQEVWAKQMELAIQQSKIQYDRYWKEWDAQGKINIGGGYRVKTDPKSGMPMGSVDPESSRRFVQARTAAHVAVSHLLAANEIIDKYGGVKIAIPGSDQDAVNTSFRANVRAAVTAIQQAETAGAGGEKVSQLREELNQLLVPTGNPFEPNVRAKAKIATTISTLRERIQGMQEGFGYERTDEGGPPPGGATPKADINSRWSGAQPVR